MRRLRRAAVVAVSAALAFPVGTAAGEDESDAAWRVAAQRLTGDDTSMWKQVSARAANDIWVAGLTRYDTDASAGVPVVSHWDGEAWRTHVFEDMLERSDVNGLSVVGPDDVWLSLRESDAKRYLHFDGTGWTRTRIAEHGRLASLSAAASDGVWAVGNAFDVPKGRVAQRYRPLAKHWDGVRWTKTPVPAKGCSLTDVVAVATNDAWAQCVGRDEHGGARSFTVLHWDGQEWTEAFGPVESASIGTFAANAAGRVWVGGTEQLWHGDGQRWTIGTLPAPTSGDATFSGRDTYAMTALPGTDEAIAVGTVYVESDGTAPPARRDVVWRSR